MILVTDIGNSDVVVGLRQAQQWFPLFRHPSAQVSTLEPALQAALEKWGATWHQIEQVILSSVVPPATPVLTELLTRLSGTSPFIPGVAHFRALGIRQAGEIGTDLVANAQAAFAHFRTACIAIDFGTALTFTAIDQMGAIAGVSIAPGLRSAMRALFENTAQLPEVPLKYPGSAIGQNTEHAIQAGVMIGYVGLVKEVLTQMKAELGEEVQTVATGGLVRVLPPIQELVDLVDPFLTLDGLCLLGKMFESD